MSPLGLLVVRPALKATPDHYSSGVSAYQPQILRPVRLPVLTISLTVCLCCFLSHIYLCCFNMQHRYTWDIYEIYMRLLFCFTGKLINTWWFPVRRVRQWFSHFVVKIAFDNSRPTFYQYNNLAERVTLSWNVFFFSNLISRSSHSFYLTGSLVKRKWAF